MLVFLKGGDIGESQRHVYVQQKASHLVNMSPCESLWRCNAVHVGAIKCLRCQLGLGKTLWGACTSNPEDTSCRASRMCKTAFEGKFDQGKHSYCASCISAFVRKVVVCLLRAAELTDVETACTLPSSRVAPHQFVQVVQ